MSKLTFLGTGTSLGVPIIGCDCAVCRSENPQDKRLRTSAYIDLGNTQIVIDAGPDFRQQMLNNNIANVDALLITHEHNDHMIGLDEVRPFNFKSGKAMPIYATSVVQSSLRKRFAYAFSDNPYPGAPLYDVHTISAQQQFELSGSEVQPIEVMHASMPVLGFRFGDFAYVTDAKTISAKEMDKLKGVKILVLNALRKREHYSHLSLEQALGVIDKIKPRETYLTHLSHEMGLHTDMEAELPEGVYLAYDSLTIEI